MNDEVCYTIFDSNDCNLLVKWGTKNGH
jgi:hypothetical protein